MSPLIKLIIFLILIAIGVFLESVFSALHDKIALFQHKEHHFKISRYFFLMSFPTLLTILVFIVEGLNAIQIFFLSAIIGTALEWLIGYSYYQIVGQRLWTYHKYGFGPYSSWLSIPLWGIGGIMFFLISQFVISK